MIDLFKRLIGNAATNNGRPTDLDEEQKVMVAVCALL